MIGIQWNSADGTHASGQSSAQAGAPERHSEADHDWSTIWQRESNRDASGEVKRDEVQRDEVQRDEVKRDAKNDANREEARRNDGSDADCFQGLMPSYPLPLPVASSGDGMSSVAAGTSLANAVADARAAQDDPAAGQPMRLHAEWSSTGVRLWVGTSLNNQAGMVLLGRPLRAGLERQGVRLLSLVCNGQIIYADAIASNADRVGADGVHVDHSRVDHASAKLPPTGAY